MSFFLKKISIYRSITLNKNIDDIKIINSNTLREVSHTTLIF